MNHKKTDFNTLVARSVLALWFGSAGLLHAGQVTWLSDLDLGKMRQPMGMRRVATAQKPILAGGEKFERGVQTRPPSLLWIDLAGQTEEFLAQVGVPDLTNNPTGSVKFSVMADGRLLWQSGVMRPGQKPQPVRVKLQGMHKLLLSVDYGGDNFRGNLALWGEARFVTAGKRPATLDAPIEKAVILTPKPPLAPRINGARVFGVRPGSPFLFTIPATGKRPMRFATKDLPPGLKVDADTGQITGELRAKGTYVATLEASNSLGVARRPLRIECGDTLALTPHMGWNSWYVWKSDVTDKIVRDAADAMVTTDLINHGYMYVNIDDCWAVRPADTNGPFKGEARDSQGRISLNERFSDMKALTDYIHAKGLKAGIYTSPGPLTCGKCTGSGEHEATDMRTFADWGFDFLKHDWCSYGRVAKDQSLPELQKPYLLASELLRSQKRDIVLNFCQYGMGEVWQWGKAVGGHSWRTAGDLGGGYYNIAAHMQHDVFDLYAERHLDRYAGPGGWNDPDYLLPGYINLKRGEPPVPTPLSPNEQYTQMSLWCLVAAPLIFSGDMTRLDDFTLNLLSNDEVIAVDQDPLGKPGRRVAKEGLGEVWAKYMEDGSLAVGLFNRSEFDSTVSVRWSDLGLTGKQRVRDLWRQTDLGDFTDRFQATLPRHGVVLVRIGPKG